MAKQRGTPNFDHLLRELSTKIMRMPGSVALRLERAQLLDRMGRTDDARKGYEDVLARDPQHYSALTDLALLHYKQGRAVEAFERYRQAAAYHPDNAVAQANFAFMLFKGGELQLAREHYERALALDPRNAETARGLAAVMTQLGDAPSTSPLNPVVSLPYRGMGKPLRVLVPVTLHAGNVRTDRLLDDRTFAVTKLVIEHCNDSVDVPSHDIVFNAIADADDAASALARASALLQSASVPVLNPPERVMLSGRAANAKRLGAIPGVRTPHIEAFSRADLSAHALQERGFRYPLLLRSIGFHSGDHFERIDEAQQLESALTRLPGERLLAIEYLDTSSPEGIFRKYRAIFVGSQIHPLHLAIARDWKVHYFSSDMHDDAGFRDEEAAYLRDMRAVIGDHAYQALASIRETLGLDYGGVDYALHQDGTLVAFEANATMVVPAPPQGDQWSYRRPAIERILNDFAQMVAHRASRTTV